MSYQQSDQHNYIVIDQGNTLVKAALFHGDDMQWFKVFKAFGQAEIAIIRHELLSVRYGIISSVSSAPEIITDTFDDIHWVILDHKTPVPIINKYKTPETLGKDRLAAVVAANALYRGKDVLVIDAGTAITYDFINKNKEYLGGSISPGLSIRLKALNTFTGRLPLVELQNFNETNSLNSELLIQNLTGNDTQDSILSGVVNGVFFEISGFINKYKEYYPDINVIITGGDAIYFDKNVKSNIFVVPNLVAYGLKLILQYNLEK